MLVLLLVSTASARAAEQIVFRRADGCAVTFAGSAGTWCDRDALHVLTLGRAKQSRWQLGIARRSLRSGRTLRFTWLRPNGVELFVYDARTRNETSDEAESSRGRIVLRHAGCRRGGRVEIAIWAFLSSELSGGEPIRVSGTFVGPVGTRPI